MGMNPRTLRPSASGFTPRSISGLALWLDAADTQTLYTTDAGPVTAVSAPTEISGCVGWYDFSDSSSLTVTSGSIDACNDKSGNGFHLSASSTNRPTLASAVRNGRNAAEFDGVNDLMTATFSGTYTATTVFAVVYPDTAGGGSLGRILTRGSSSLAYDGTNTAFRYNAPFTGATGNGGQRTANGSATQDQWHLASFTWNGGLDVATAIVPYLSGVTSNAALTGTGDAVSTTGINDFILGNRSLADGADRGWDGYVAEIILFNTALSTANRARVEAYLAAKWGISGVHAQATATSDPVGYWGDKSGNARHMRQPSSSPRPVRSTQNNRSSLSFNGTSQWMRQERTNFQMQTALIAWRRTGTPISFASPFAANGSVAATLGGAAYVSSDAHSLTYNVGSAGNHYWGSNIAANRATAVRSLGATQSAANFAVFTSGVTLAPNTSDVALVSAVFATSGAGNKAFFAGIEPFADTRHYPCQLLEVLLYNGVLTDAQIARIERYLASKWGITLAPQVSNADAQDWINRVYGNGGTVSATTATAVNTFCNAIDAAGIRDRFYRLNLFAGNSDASLNAVRTPLYRGPSLGETQYGGATDTNVNFVQGDYAETGASGGLLGNGSTKYLETGFSLASLPSAASRHISVYEIVKSANTNDASIGGTASASVDGMVLHTKSPATAYAWSRGGPNEAVAAAGSYSGGAHWIGQNTTLRASQLYKNGSLDNSATLAADVTSTAANTVSVFAWKITGGTPDPTWVYHSAARLGGYSIGVSMSNAQASAYYTALQAFQTALGRNV